MSDMKDLVEQARKLGKALSEHPTVRGFTSARTAVQADAAAQDLLKQYNEQAERLRMLETENKPIEVADKQKLREIEGAMASNDALKQMTRYQADYLALMSQVNQAIESGLSGTTGGDAA